MNNEHAIENEEIEIDLENLFLNFIVGIKKFGIILLVLIALYTGFRYFKAKLSYQPLYKCEAAFAVSTNGNDVTQLVKTYSYLLTGSMMRDIVSNELNVGTIPAQISISEVENTNFLLLQATSNDASMAYQVVSSILNNYNSTLSMVISNVELEVIVPPQENNVPINASNELQVAKQSLLLSGLVAVGILFIYALLRRTVQSGKDFRQSLHINHFASIPSYKFKKRSHKIDKRLIITNSKISQDFIDSFKLLRRRIENIQMQKGSKVFLITGCAPREGKTTIALNLAISLANKGKKTILIDGDLRTLELNQILNLNFDIDIVDIINKEILNEEIGVDSGIENLKVLSGTKKVSNSSEILSSEFVPKLLAYLKEKYDYVIIDSAPVGLLGDGKILARYCDGVIIVVRQDRIRSSTILRNIEKLADENIEIYGGVLNDTKRHFGYYGYYNKYYNYRYHYSKRN